VGTALRRLEEELAGPERDKILEALKREVHKGG
jgi:hypothetical protein